MTKLPKTNYNAGQSSADSELLAACKAAKIALQAHSDVREGADKTWGLILAKLTAAIDKATGGNK